MNDSVEVAQPDSSHSAITPFEIAQEIIRDTTGTNCNISNESTPRSRRLERSPRRSDHFDQRMDDGVQPTPKAGNGTRVSIGPNTRCACPSHSSLFFRPLRIPCPRSICASEATE